MIAAANHEVKPSNQEKASQGAQRPLSCFNESQKLQDGRKADGAETQSCLTLRKCKCNSIWCPQCFKLRKSKGISERLRRMDWRYVRQLVLTVDPRLFDDGGEALDFIQEKKGIPQMLHNLQRTKGVGIRDWVWVLEWHRNGYPHWHLFVEVDKRGKAGQLYSLLMNEGGQEQRKWGTASYWRYGYIHEDFIRNERHWDYVTGYFQAHGYFDKKKAHQAALPEWAKDSTRRIRRSGSKRIQSHLKDKVKEIIKERKEKEKKQMLIDQLEKGTLDDLYCEDEIIRVDCDPIRTYRVILDECGDETQATLFYHENGKLLRVVGFPVRISYEQMKKDYPGEYKPGLGICITMDTKQLNLFKAKYRILI